MSEPRLILFDIDQTLIYTDGAGMRCLGRAAREVCGVDLSMVVPDGKTDPAIVREGLRAAGIPADRWRAVEDEVFLRYADYLARELEAHNPARCLKPGVADLLDRLDRASWAWLGLLTGNMETTGRIKLQALGLDHHFPVGAFGSDCADRCRLGSVALERARRHYGVAFEPGQTWVVGDTAHDVAAAHAAGARALAVATGRYSRAVLEEGMPAAALDDLSDLGRVFEILRG